MDINPKIYRHSFGTSNYTQFGTSNYDQFFGEEVTLILAISGFYVLEPVIYFHYLESIDWYKMIEHIQNYYELEGNYNA